MASNTNNSNQSGVNLMNNTNRLNRQYSQFSSDSFEKDLNKYFRSLTSQFQKFERSNKDIMKNIMGISETEQNMNNFFNRMQGWLDGTTKKREQQEKLIKDMMGKNFEEYKKMIEEQEKEQEEIDKKQKKRIKELLDLKKQGILTDEQREELNIHLQAQFDEVSDRSAMILDRTASSVSSRIGSTIAKGITTAVTDAMNIWINRFDSSVNRIVDTYENTFHDVAVRMDWNQYQYQEFQQGIQKSIHEDNLDQSIRISDVMQQFASVVESGITSNEAQSIAYQDTITSTINPYVDVTSTAYKDLQMSLGTDFVNAINGIGSYASENIGQTRFIQSHLNDIIASLEPISKESTINLAEQDAGLAAGAEQMRALGYTESAVQEWLTNSYQMMDPYSALTGGNTAVKIAEANALNNGIDTSTDVVSGAQYLLDTLSSFSDKTSNSIERGAVANVLGFSYDTFRQLNSKDLDEIFEKMNITQKELEQQSSDKLSSVSKTFTERQKKDNISENSEITLLTAIAQEKFPDTISILKDIANAIPNAIQTFASTALGNIVGNGATRLAGSAIGRLGGSLSSVGQSAYLGVGILGESALAAGGIETAGISTGALVGAGTATIAGTVAGVASVGKGIYDLVDSQKSFNKTFAQQQKEQTVGAIEVGAPLIGAAIGTAVAPVIGTAIGAGVGAIVGFASNAFIPEIERNTLEFKNQTETLNDMYNSIDNGTEETSFLYSYIKSKYSEYFKEDVKTSDQIRKTLEKISGDTGKTVEELVGDKEAKEEKSQLDVISSIMKTFEEGKNVDDNKEFKQFLNANFGSASGKTDEEKDSIMKEYIEPIINKLGKEYENALSSGNYEEAEKYGKKITNLSDNLNGYSSYYNDYLERNYGYEEGKTTDNSGNILSKTNEYKYITGTTSEAGFYLLRNSPNSKKEFSSKELNATFETAKNQGIKSTLYGEFIDYLKGISNYSINNKGIIIDWIKTLPEDDVKLFSLNGNSEKIMENDINTFIEKRDNGTLGDFREIFTEDHFNQYREGSNYINEDQIAILHKGEGVTTRETNAKLLSAGIRPKDPSTVDRALESNENETSNQQSSGAEAIISAMNNCSRQIVDAIEMLQTVMSAMNNGSKISERISSKQNNSRIKNQNSINLQAESFGLYN